MSDSSVQRRVWKSARYYECRKWRAKSSVKNSPLEIAVLSGPTFAREVAGGVPTALVISSTDYELTRSVQHEFSGPTFRLYTNDDPAGVEIGAALKNTNCHWRRNLSGAGLREQFHRRADNSRADGNHAPGGRHGRSERRPSPAWPAWEI